jgi:hypothetical protein
MNALRLSTGLLLLLLLPMLARAAPAAERHDRAFWRAIVANDFAVPKNETPAALVAELSEYLGSPDPELRDVFGYEIPAAWIFRDKLLAPPDLRSLLARWSANLRAGIGERGTDSVLRRSFSAVDLSILAALDNERPFLSAAEFQALLEAALSYLASERDLRGYDREIGWVHATAHTADLLKFLARSRHLRPADQARILQAVDTRLTGAGEVFSYGEDERLARVVFALVRRSDIERTAFEAWVGSAQAPNRDLWKASPRIDPQLYAAVQNLKNLRKSLAVLLAKESTPSPQEAAAQKALLRALEALF